MMNRTHRPYTKTYLPGEALRTARELKGISLVKASDDTKIRREVLDAFEQGETAGLSAIYAKALQRTYIRYLGLELPPPPKPTARRSKHPKIFTPRRLLRRPVSTMSLLVKFAVSMVVFLALSYAAIQAYRLFSPPSLSINEPSSSELLVTSSSLKITGHTDPGVNVFIGEQQVLIEPDGRFQATVSLRSGLNDIELRAVNALGKIATRRLTVVSIPQDT